MTTRLTQLGLVTDDGTHRDNGDGAGPEHVRIAIVGSGFAGLGMAIRLKEAGIEDFVVLERADDVGGTWQANTYPGCQCDVPSHLYSFSFEPNPRWTRTYSRQPEIWAYLRGCAERYGLARAPAPRPRADRRDVGRADAALARRDVAGTLHRASLVIDATGPLSHPSMPRDPRPRRLRGQDVPLRRSGTTTTTSTASASRSSAPARRRSSSCRGSSRRSAQMHVFQRTPPWIMPHSDRPDHAPRAPAVPRCCRSPQRAVRTAVYWRRETLVLGFAKHPSMAQPAERIARCTCAARSATASCGASSSPDFRLGCKRVLISNDWYPALTKPNVELVTRGDHAGRRARDRARRRQRAARSTRSSSARAFTSPTRRRRGSCAGAAARRSPRPPAQPAGLPRHGDGRLPEPLPDHRPEHRPRPQLDGLHDRVAAGLRHGRDPPDGRARHRDRRGAPGGRRGVQRGDPGDDARHGVGVGLLELVPRRAAATTRRCGRTSRSASASARARFDADAYELRTASPSPRRSRDALACPSPARRSTSPGRTVFVTGAARGIGAAVATRLHAAGANVALVGLEPELLEAARGRSSATARSRSRPTSPTSAALERAVRETVSRFGAIDVAIANAGISYIGRLATAPVEQVERALEVNLMGVWRTNRAVIEPDHRAPRLPAEHRLARAPSATRR